MREIKHDRTVEVLHRLAAEFIRDNSGKTSLITVTRVELSPTGKETKIFFTTIPEGEENTVLKFLERKTQEFKDYIKSKSRVSPIPRINFHIDYGERNRQRLDELGNQE